MAAAAAAPTIRVEAQACPGVDAREVERLLAIELGALAPAGPIDVALSCTPGHLRMTARDPILDRQLVREVAMGPPEEGRDRTIALLVSQLFLTSWAEEFLEHPGPRPPAPPAPAATVARVAASPAPVAAAWELQLEAGVRLRDWAAPALGEQLSGIVGRRAGPLRLLAVVGFERGSANRAAGTAVWTIGQVGGGLAWASVRPGRLAFGAALLGSAALAQVRGEPGSAAVTGETVSGVLGQVALSAGPRLVSDAWRVGLNLELGAAVPGAAGRISGDRDLKLSGPWAGACLSVAWGRP